MAEAVAFRRDDARFRLMSLIHMTEKLCRAKELKILAFGAESDSARHLARFYSGRRSRLCRRPWKK